MKEEKYIKDILVDYESPMELDFIWTNLDKALDQAEIANTSASITVHETISTSPVRKYLPLLLLLLVSGCGFLAYKNFDKLQLSKADNSTRVVPTEMADDKHNYKRNSGTAVALESEAAKEVNSVLKSIPDEDKVSRTKQNSVPTKYATTKETTTKKTAKPITRSTQTQTQNLVKTTGAGSPITIPPTTSQDNIVNETGSTNRETSGVPIIKKEEDKVQISLLDQINKETVAEDNLAVLSFLNRLNSKTVYLDYTRDLALDLDFAKVVRARRIIPEKEKIKSWRIGMHSGITSSDYDVLFSTNGNDQSIFDESSENSLVSIKRLSKPTFGIQLEKIFTSGLKLSTGLNYINQGITITQIDTLEQTGFTEISRTISEPQTDDFGNFITITTVTSLREVTLRKQTDNLEIKMLQLPLLVGYEKTFSKFDLGLSVGLGLNYGIFDEENLLDLSIINISGLADFQVGYNFAERFRIYGSAFAGSHLLGHRVNPELITIESTSVTLNHYGLRAGISYML